MRPLNPSLTLLCAKGNNSPGLLCRLERDYPLRPTGRCPVIFYVLGMPLSLEQDDPLPNPELEWGPFYPLWLSFSFLNCRAFTARLVSYFFRIVERTRFAFVCSPSRHVFFHLCGTLGFLGSSSRLVSPLSHITVPPPVAFPSPVIMAGPDLATIFLLPSRSPNQSADYFQPIPSSDYFPSPFRGWRPQYCKNLRPRFHGSYADGPPELFETLALTLLS